MPKDLTSLIAARDALRQQQKVHNLRGEALAKRLDKAEAAVQEACPHDNIEETSSYCTGGYDYCAESFYKHTCTTCDKVLKQWSKTHYGIYG